MIKQVVVTLALLLATQTTAYAGWGLSDLDPTNPDAAINEGPAGDLNPLNPDSGVFDPSLSQEDLQPDSPCSDTYGTDGAVTQGFPSSSQTTFSILNQTNEYMNYTITTDFDSVTGTIVPGEWGRPRVTAQKVNGYDGCATVTTSPITIKVTDGRTVDGIYLPNLGFYTGSYQVSTFNNGSVDLHYHESQD